MLRAQTRVPEVEPNNTPATAQAILVGDQIDCNLVLVAGEQDWFSFTLAAAGRIRVHTSGINTTADTRIALLDGTGTTYLAIDDDARGGTQSWSSEVQLNVAAGSYMVQVVPFDAAATGLYSLEVASITPVVYDGVEAEPNDTHTTATPTGVLGVGVKRFHGALSPNAIVASGSVDLPAIPPVVFSGVCAASTALISGSVAAAPATTTTVTQTTPLSQPAANPLLASYVPGMNIRMTSGANAGLARLITSNTAFSVTAAGFPVASSSGDTWDIVTTNTTAVTWVNSLPLGSLYVATSGYSMTMTSGANIGLTRTISANTGPSPFGSEITTAAWPVANSPGDTFDITCTGSTTTFRVVGGLVANIYNPTTGITGSTAGLGHYHVRFTSGVNAGLTRQICGNTAASLTLASALTAAPGAGDTFDIERADSDYYQVVLTAPSTGFWFQINEGDAPAVFGHRYELYDAAGNALLPASSLQLPAFGTQQAVCGNLAARTSSARVWPAGTYYVAVRNPLAPFTAATTMPGGVIPSGNYMLEVFTMPMDTGGTINEVEAVGVQTNNTVATAEPFVPGQVVRGNVTASTGTDASDWYGPLVLAVPSAISFQTRRNAASPAASQMLDSTVNLRTSTGVVALAATSGNVLDAPVPGSTSSLHGRQVVTFFLAPDTYYIEVAAPGTTAFPLAQQFGDYELETSVLIPAPYVLASYGTFASNAGCGAAPQPVLTRQFTTEVPATGNLFSRQITSLTPSWVGLHVIGISNIPPFDLAIPFGGTLGACFLNVSPDVINTVLSDPAGNVELQIFIPGSIALRGAVLWEQAMDLDLTAPNGFFLQPGNYGRFIVGERTF
ncbi:MAG TPA: DVUA0089 family protein [Planctomycetota bacterium]|nr:DVUA0089 family protein [Planctomycetota bacterium]